MATTDVELDAEYSEGVRHYSPQQNVRICNNHPPKIQNLEMSSF